MRKPYKGMIGTIVLLLLIICTSFGAIGICSQSEIQLNGSIEIKSPGYPNKYTPRTTCKVNMMHSLIPLEVVFTEFDLENGTDCRHDYLSINGVRYCGNKTGQRVKLEEPRTRLTHLEFRTDHSVEGKGFLVKFIYFSESCTLAMSKSQLPLNVTSPGFPGTYPSNLTCQGLLTWVSNMPRLLIRFIRFSLEGDEESNCKFDVFHVGTLRLCGNHTGQTIELDILHKHSLSLMLKTDDSVQGDGIKIEFSFPPASDVCEKQFLNPPVLLRSSNYPQFYPSNSNCVAFITTTVDVSIEIQDFMLENKADFLYIGNKRYTGNQTGTIITVQNKPGFVPIQFISDKTINQKGFLIKITAAKPLPAGGPA